eukprot:SAG31_NODE_1006_length_10432_cov_3.272718_2_plen_538_part_00
MELDTSKCGGAASSKRDRQSWEVVRDLIYSGGCPENSDWLSSLPGWTLDEMGEWVHEDDAELAALMNFCATEKRKELDAELLETFKQDGTLKKYHRLDDRDTECILKRTVVITRLSSVLQAVMPMVDLVGTSDEGTGAIRRLRTLMLSKHKNAIIQTATQAVRKAEISMPRIEIDRTKARWEGEDPTGKRSIFGQIYDQLKQKGAVQRSGRECEIFRGAERWWKVDFKNEHLSDAGGGFRETVSNISDDLNSDRTPLFIPTPNNSSGVGDIRDAWMPNPDCLFFDQYEFVGQLMAAAIQSQESVVVKWPTFVWKTIAHFPCKLEDYSSSIDESVLRYTDVAKDMTSEEFDLLYGDNFVFAMENSNGTIVELIPGGSELVVTFENRSEFVKLLSDMRFGEISQQCEAIRRGLLRACIPAPVLGLWSVHEFQLAVCGRPEIDIEQLKQQTTFEGSEGPGEVFWRVMESLSHEERSSVLKFASGRLRLPVNLKVEWQSDSDRLPRAATCYNKIYLPRYSSFDKMRKKIIIAIQCMSIDTD